MKINKNDIDQALIEKVSRLDNIVDNFKDEDRSNFVAYDGSSFYLKKISDLNIRRIISEEDIKRYEDNLYEQSSLLKNSFKTNFNINNIATLNLKSQIVKPVEEVLYTSTGRILLSARKESVVYFFNDKGILVKYDLINLTTHGVVDIIKEIKSNFAIPEIAPYDFLYLEPVLDGVLISTMYNGIFFYDFEKKILEVKFPESAVVIMKTLSNGNIFCGVDRTDGNIVVFNFETGLKVEISSVLKRKMFQIPYLVDAYKDELFLVGKPFSLNTTKHTLHYWKKDAGKISFNNADGEVFPGYDHKNYYIKYLLTTDNFVYTSGLTDKDELFVWQYNLRNLAEPYREFSFNAFKFSELSFAELNEEYFIAADGEKLYYMNTEGKVEKNLVLTDKVNKIFFSKNKTEIFVLSDYKLTKVIIPEYKYTPEIVLEILNSEITCNNIDILVKSSDGREKYMFLDTEKLSPIAPFYIATHEDKTVIKLLGTTAKKITMKIISPESTQITGIVVNQNRLFLK